MNLGKFDHHRASEDAEILTGIFMKFVERLKTDFAVSNISQINSALSNIQGRSRSVKGLPINHLIILVKNGTGLKNLYRLVSKAHLETFNEISDYPQKRAYAIPRGLDSRFRV